MVGSGVAVLLDPGDDRGLVAPDDERVDEAVAAAVGEVVVGEALAASSCSSSSAGRGSSRGATRAMLAGRVRVGLEHDGLLAGDEAVGPSPRGRIAVSSGVTRYGWAPAVRVAGQLEHLRAERGEHPIARRRAAWRAASSPSR